MSQKRIALSIKQPWATLIVHGIKQVELRRWSTNRSGWIFIHTGRSIDQNPAGWAFVPRELNEFAHQTGGVIGKARLAGCREYKTLAEFSGDRRLHRAPDGFFVPPIFGFLFVQASVVPFEPRKGNLYFFEI